MAVWVLGVVVGLALMGVMTHVGGERAEEAHPPVGQFAVVDGVRLHYTDRGEGPPVVLIHGASTSLLDFEASLVAPLSRTHRVIAVDRPGHGYSERRDGPWPDPAEQARLIHLLLRDLGVESPVVVGHSWSGSVVLAYLLDYPDSTGGGVLLAGGSHAWEGGVAWYNDLAGVPVLGDVFVRTVTYPVGRLSIDSAIHNVFDPNPVPEGYREQTGVALSLRPSAFSANAEDVRRLSDFLATQSERYAEIDRPLLLLTGNDDEIVPSWNHADRLERQVERIERIDFDDTGHALHHARPQEVADAISRFALGVGGNDRLAQRAAERVQPSSTP
jgi:pimeloyl-ACP methyl ester carboxylesterase